MSVLPNIIHQSNGSLIFINVMNNYGFQVHAIIQCHGYIWYQTLQKTGHESRDSRHLKKRHMSGKF